MKDLSKFKKDYAIYTPAISSAYSGFLSRPDNRELGEKLTWLKQNNPPNNPFFYECNLYSAGHVELDPEKSKESDWFIHNRDKENTLMIGDSGGFQIAKGKLKFDWDDEFGKSANNTRMKILRWLEATTDLAMTLDYPTWNITNPDSPVKDFNHCIKGTLYNLDYFVDNQANPDTKFLNILHGRNNEECLAWYNAVKRVPLHGWAIGGPTKFQFVDAVKRLLLMRDDGAFEEGRDWLHMLGLSKASAGIAATILQQVLREHVNPNIQLSFDSASPYLTAAFGNFYREMIVNNGKITFKTDSLPKSKDLLTCEDHWPHYNPLSNETIMKDLVNEKQKYLWKTSGYIYVMYHNTYFLCTNLEEIQKDFIKGEKSKYNFPQELLNLREVLHEIFRPGADVDRLISQHRELLNNSVSNEVLKHHEEGTSITFGKFFGGNQEEIISEISDEVDDQISKQDYAKGTKTQLETLFEISNNTPAEEKDDLEEFFKRTQE